MLSPAPPATGPRSGRDPAGVVLIPTSDAGRRSAREHMTAQCRLLRAADRAPPASRSHPAVALRSATSRSGLTPVVAPRVLELGEPLHELQGRVGHFSPAAVD